MLNVTTNTEITTTKVKLQSETVTWYFRGNRELLTQRAIGFCGTRKPSEIATKVAEDCAEQVVRYGFVLVAGYAAGIDTTAHYQALAHNGSTIIVLPEGVERFRIKRVLRDVWDWDRVLVVSQFEPDDHWTSANAMTRNKTVIHLSKAMVLIAARFSSGTFNAGMETLRQRKKLFVARYSQSDDGPANNLLIERGGNGFGRNRKIGLANMSFLRNLL